MSDLTASDRAGSGYGSKVPTFEEGNFTFWRLKMLSHFKGLSNGTTAPLGARPEPHVAIGNPLSSANISLR